MDIRFSKRQNQAVGALGLNLEIKDLIKKLGGADIDVIGGRMVGIGTEDTIVGIFWVVLAPCEPGRKEEAGKAGG